MPVPYRGQQSPIDLHDARQFVCEFPPDFLTFYYPEHLTGRVVGTGHETNFVFVTPGAKTGVTLDGQFYQLLQIHYHHPAEHRNGKEHYPVELHIVHHRTPVPGAPPLEPEDEEYVVLAIWVKEKEKADQANAHVDTFLREVGRRVKDWQQGKASADDIVDVRLNELLPPNPGQYYFYEGSLTTKTRDDNLESVHWILFRYPHLATPREVKGFGKIEHEGKVKQYVNRRFVLKSFRDAPGGTA